MPTAKILCGFAHVIQWSWLYECYSVQFYVTQWHWFSTNWLYFSIIPSIHTPWAQPHRLWAWFSNLIWSVSIREVDENKGLKRVHFHCVSWAPQPPVTMRICPGYLAEGIGEAFEWGAKSLSWGHPWPASF